MVMRMAAASAVSGSLVVGDSHEYGAAPDPFFSSDVEAAILRLAESVLPIPNREVIECWIGLYPH
jgi:hypothetical protein